MVTARFQLKAVLHCYTLSDRKVFSMRAGERTLRALEEEARRYRLPARTLAEAILDEGLRVRRHPGITFVDRGGGRAAVCAGYPRLSIWQVVLTVRASRSQAAAARHLNVDVPAVERALAYAREYPEDIDAAIQANEEALERAKRLYPPALTPAPRRPRHAAAPR